MPVKIQIQIHCRFRMIKRKVFQNGSSLMKKGTNCTILSSRVSRGERKTDAVLDLIHSKLENSFEHKEIDSCHLS